MNAPPVASQASMVPLVRAPRVLFWQLRRKKKRTHSRKLVHGQPVLAEDVARGFGGFH